MNNTSLLIGKANNKNIRHEISCNINNSITNHENILVFSDNVSYYSDFLRKLNEEEYNTYILNLKDSSHSNGFNPFILPYKYYKSGKKDKAVEMLESIGHEICKEKNSNSDPFWENSATSYFTTLALILFKEGSYDEINLGSIQTMLTLGEKKFEDTNLIKKYFSTLDIMDPIYVFGSQVIYSPSETRASIISVLKQKLNLYCTKEILLNNLCNNEIDLSILNNKTAIFIIGDTKYNGISNILINQIFNQNKEFSYYIDKIEKLNSITELENMIDNNEKIFITSSSKQEISDIYGNNLINNINYVKDVKEEYEILDKCNINLPDTKINKHNYFNIEDFIRKC